MRNLPKQSCSAQGFEALTLSAVIYRVDTNGKASIFAKSDLFKGEGFNLNGIVYHPKGFLLVSTYNSDELFKININNPSQVEKVTIAETFPGLGFR